MMTSIKKELLKLTNATFVLVLGSIIAGISHWFAHSLLDIRFTLLGFLAATLSGIYYGLQVPDRTKEKKIKKLESKLTNEKAAAQIA